MIDVFAMDPRKRYSRFSILFMMTYMVSYLTRINFGAVIVEMVDATGIARSVLSLAVTGAFFTYGVGQVVSGFLGDRMQPKLVVLAGLMVTALMNLLVPFFKNPAIIIVLWCINGVAQAFIWPPLVRLMLYIFDGNDYTNCAVRVTIGSSIGTIAIYIITPIIISIADWRFVFWFSACTAIIMAIVWQKVCINIEPNVSEKGAAQPAIAQSTTKSHFSFSVVMIMVMLSIVCYGALRDSITTWMPSFISDNYNLGNAVSILTGTVLPIFTIFVLKLSAWIYNHFMSNTQLSTGIYFLITTIAAAILMLTNGISPLISVVMLTLMNACMHCVGQMQTVIAPAYFKHTGKVSLISGVMNACTYIGSSASIYGIALISERAGWNATLMLWLGLALCGMILGLGFARPWGRYVKKLEKEAQDMENRA